MKQAHLDSWMTSLIQRRHRWQGKASGNSPLPPARVGEIRLP